MSNTNQIEKGKGKEKNLQETIKKMNAQIYYINQIKTGIELLNHKLETHDYEDEEEVSILDNLMDHYNCLEKNRDTLRVALNDLQQNL